MVDADIPDMSGLAIASTSTNRLQQLPHMSSPAPRSADDQLDTSLPTALTQLVHRLTQPLSTVVPHARLLDLREALREVLHDKYAPTWDEDLPMRGSGYRSLICQKGHGLPVELRSIANRFQVDPARWLRALALTKTVEGVEIITRTEWEAWCDPGVVAWRYGSWEWEDVGFEPTRPIRDPIKVIWQAIAPSQERAQAELAASFTPARPSHAIPIKAPTLFQIAPTPTRAELRPSSPSLLPAISIGFGNTTASHAQGASSFSSPESEDDTNGRNGDDPSSYGGEPLPRLQFGRQRDDKPTRHRSGHSGSNSTSSVDSALSDTNSGLSQLMTPGSRPGSADIFEMTQSRSAETVTKPRGRTPSPGTPHAEQRDSTTPATVTGATPAPASSTTPTITPYDGGNVTVLGGGVRLGGSSRPSSVMSSHRTPIDRSRSPSISLASRALNSAVGPNSTGGLRKPRTRRRIMPTYLGSIHQPGVGGPINGVFSQFTGGQGAPQGYNVGVQGGAVWQGPPQAMPRPPTQPVPRSVS